MIELKSKKAVWVFLGGYVLMLIAFILGGGVITAIWGEKTLLESSSVLYMLFAVQQIVTLIVLWRAMDE